MKHATPLPWAWHSAPSGRWIVQRTDAGSAGPVVAQWGPSLGRDAAYISHAAHAYPRLVEALRRCAILAGNGEMGPSKVAEVNHLLRDLGEL